MRTESKLLRVSWNPNDMNGEHLSPKTRELLDKPIEERIAHIQKDSWIPYSQANKILQQLEDLLQHPKCDRMPNLAISAQTNNGKTRLMKHFLSLHQANETSSGPIAAPVFYVQSPSIPEESRLYSAILLKLCKKFRPSAPPQEKLVLVLDALSKIEIRILALDEVNFTEVGTAAKQKRFLNALRYLANELRISIVCLGTEEMMRVIRSVSSVENRFPPINLPRWRTDDEFRQLLASFEKINSEQRPPFGLRAHGGHLADFVWSTTGRCVGPRSELFVDHVVGPVVSMRDTRSISSRSTACASMRASGAPRHR
jgi:hypothetical protein